ncbi:hypothetical protein K504DRAFT_202873 [Pleomassaria siparia CBS 279.74]|uniref:Uncharacterized protein n=1 Tax=Pleomassaria siparia CBS 279.74 TaxID=1314801 RepID=A0A6G1KJ04_9PLEO|nr:hypothetical protein K504DRAFT_202873 [Pleomassaria siparia CBS 279.74]
MVSFLLPPGLAAPVVSAVFPLLSFSRRSSLAKQSTFDLLRCLNNSDFIDCLHLQWNYRSSSFMLLALTTFSPSTVSVLRLSRIVINGITYTTEHTISLCGRKIASFCYPLCFFLRYDSNTRD